MSAKASGRARPSKPWGAIPAAVAMTGIWWLVAHSSGQGWVQALGELVFGGLVVGVLGPWLVVRRASATVVAGPTDAVTGQPVELVLHRSRPSRVAVALPGDRRAAGPGRFADRVTVVPFRRGVHRQVTLVVATAAPFGLQWWSRRLVVDLPHPLHVAPATGRGRSSNERDTDGATEGGVARRAAAGELRAARPYARGDSRSLVHWPASAHTGVLMVRDLELRAGPPAELVVVLPPEENRAEAAAGTALAQVLAFLDAGRPVLLSTEEENGVRVGLVTDARTARRRLAASVARRG